MRRWTGVPAWSLRLSLWLSLWLPDPVAGGHMAFTGVQCQTPADGSAFDLCSVFGDRFEIRGPVLSDLLPLETVERRLLRKQQEEAAHERRRRRRRPSKKGQGSQSDRADRSSRAEAAAGNVGGSGWLPEVEVVESGAVSSGTGGLVEEEEVMRFMLPRAQT